MDSLARLHELKILSAVFKYSKEIDSFMLPLKPAYFRESDLIPIAEACCQLYVSQFALDRPLVLHHLRSSDNTVEWSLVLDEIMHCEVNLDEVMPLIYDLRDFYVHDAINQGFESIRASQLLPQQRIDSSLNLLFDLRELYHSSSALPIQTISRTCLLDISNVNPLQRISTGLFQLDKYLCGGMDKGQLFVVAARPNHGKTNFLVHMCQQMSIVQQKKVLYISFMLSSQQFMYRMVSNISHVPLGDFKSQTTLDKVPDAVNTLLQAESDEHLFFYPLQSTKLNEVLATIYLYKRRHGIEAVIIDSLQMMDENEFRFGKTRNLLLGQVTKQLRKIAEEENLLILAGSQVNRSADFLGSNGRYPISSDLKDSGYIEEYAHSILFLYRPELYGLGYWDDGKVTQESIGLSCVKNYMGASFRLELGYIESSGSFLMLKESLDKENLAIPNSREVDWEGLIYIRHKNDDIDAPF